MSVRPARPLSLLAAAALCFACGKAADDGAARLDSHVFSNERAGVALDLPALWAGRYHSVDSITTPADGLERMITLKYVMKDSSEVSAPLLVIRVFSNTGWGKVNPDSAGAWWGTIVARDGARTVMVKPSPANPLAQGTADALGYDSLMIELLARPMRASLRAPGR